MVIDRVLDKITMYRLVLYYLIGLLVAAELFSAMGLLPYSPADIAIAILIAISVSWTANSVFARIFHATTNKESVLITALIIVCLVSVEFPYNALYIAAACGVVMASKYILAIKKQHVFNPAAVGVLIVGLLFPDHTAMWWMGTPIMIPFVVLGGLVLVRRIRRGLMVFLFVVAYLFFSSISSIAHGSFFESFPALLHILVFRSPMWFLGFVMLTEPLTAPGRKRPQLIYGALVGLLAATQQMGFLPLRFTPEEALCIGNIAAYIMTPRHRFALKLHQKIQLTSDTLQFIFKPIQPLAFKAGQYMEWSLPHPNTDSRGNRRYFSIVSAPASDTLSIAVKFYEHSSSYKTRLKNLQIGEEIIAAQLGGDFTLPRNVEHAKLVFIAGGIGITPYISMIEYIIHKEKKCDIVVLYCVKSRDDIAFSETLKKAQEFGVSIVYVVTEEIGILDAAMIQQHVPDFLQRTFYISGPRMMVQSVETMLAHMHIKKRRILTDYFPGFA